MKTKGKEQLGKRITWQNDSPDLHPAPAHHINYPRKLQIVTRPEAEHSYKLYALTKLTSIAAINYVQTIVLSVNE